MTTTIGLAGVLELLELVGGLLGLWTIVSYCGLALALALLCLLCCGVALLLGPLFGYSRTVGSPRQWDISILF